MSNLNIYPDDHPVCLVLLCWDMGNGEVRFQTNSPRHRRALHRLKGFKQVGYSLSEVYLALYQGRMTMRDAKAFVDRRLGRY